MSKNTSLGYELHSLFEKVNKVAASDRAAYEAFAKAIEADVNDVLVIIVIAEVVRRLVWLEGQVKEDVSIGGVARKTYLDSVTRIRQGMSFGRLNRSFKEFSTEVLREQDTNTILLLDDLLVRRDGYVSPDEDDLTSLSEELDALISNCEVLNIEEKLQAFLLGRLYDLKFTIMNFDAFGLSYFRDQVIVTTANVKFAESASGSDSEFFEKFFKWVDRINAIAQLAPLLPRVLNAVSKLIGGP